MEILSLDTYFHASHQTTLGPLEIKLFINPQTLCAIPFTTLKTRYEVYIRPLLGLSSFLQTHHELTLSQENLCFIIQEYGKHGRIDQAVKLFNRAFNCLQSVEVYNALLFSLCQAKLFHGAYALVRRLIRKGLVPNKMTCSILVNAWCSNGKMKEAQLFLEEMSEKRFNPPVRGRDLMVEGLLNAGYIEAAKDMVRKMVKQSCAPDVSTFNALIEAICKCGEVEFCIDLYW